MEPAGEDTVRRPSMLPLKGELVCERRGQRMGKGEVDTVDWKGPRM